MKLSESNASMFSRVGKSIHGLILVFMLVLGPVIHLFAASQDFSFLIRAQTHYRHEIATEGVHPADHLLDSLMRLPVTVLDFRTAADISWKTGLLLLEKGKHAAALDIFIHLRQHLEGRPSLTKEESVLLSSVLNITGAIYEETGLWNEALSLYLRSLQICDSIGNEAGKAKVYNNIGNLYFTRNELKRAEELFYKAIDINRRLGIRPELFNNYNNLGGIYKKMDNPGKALEYLLIALGQLDIEHDHYDLSFAYSNIGSLYQEMKVYPVAMSYYQQAAAIQKERDYTGAWIRSLLSMASLYQALHMPDSARQCISTALTTVKLLGNPSQTMSVLIEAAGFHERTGNFREATGFYTRYVALKDSMESLNSLTKIEQIQSVYEILNKEKDNKILQQTIHLQQLAIQRQRIVLITAIVLFLILGSFMFYLLRSRKRERQRNELIAKQTHLLHQKEKEMMIHEERNLKMELDYKNRRFTSYALKLARTNEFILKITGELKELLLDLSPRDKDRSGRLKKFMSELQQYSSGHDWEEFRLYFEEVHQSFEKNLLEAYPQLSPNDRKICAMLKLGLSTKDIAAITFRELRSVESARNRLRKKFGLPAEVSLSTFLSKF